MSLFVPKPIRKGQNDQSAAGTGVGKTFPEPLLLGRNFLSLEIKSGCWGSCISQNLGGLELF